MPHPHDVLLAKLERWDTQDRAHAVLILAAFPLSTAALDQLAARTPYRGGRITSAERCHRFEAHLAELRASLAP